MIDDDLIEALERALDLAIRADRRFLAWLISLALAEAGAAPGVSNDNGERQAAGRRD